MNIEEQLKGIVIDQKIKELEIARNLYLQKLGIPNVKAPLHPMFGRRLNRDKTQ